MRENLEPLLVKWQQKKNFPKIPPKDTRKFYLKRLDK